MRCVRRHASRALCAITAARGDTTEAISSLTVTVASSGAISDWARIKQLYLPDNSVTYMVKTKITRMIYNILIRT